MRGLRGSESDFSQRSQTPFEHDVLRIVCSIPFGRVTTYGDIARACGAARSSRLVGWILNKVKNRDEVPCHRVLNRFGYLSGRMHFAHPNLMQEMLEAEGVTVVENQVDLTKYLWRPSMEV